MPQNSSSPWHRSVRVEGTIRDKDSGRPIAGLEIQAAVFDEQSLIPAPGIDATTDAEGRYRVNGLTRAAGLSAVHQDGRRAPIYQRHLQGPGRVVRAGAGHLRYRDEARGADPRAGRRQRSRAARSKAMPIITRSPTTPACRHYAGFSESYEQFAHFDEDGRYEVVGLPGRGLIAVREETDQYRPASGYEKIAGFDAKHRMFSTAPSMAQPRQPRNRRRGRRRPQGRIDDARPPGRPGKVGADRGGRARWRADRRHEGQGRARAVPVGPDHPSRRRASRFMPLTRPDRAG